MHLGVIKRLTVLAALLAVLWPTASVRAQPWMDLMGTPLVNALEVCRDGARFHILGNDNFPLSIQAVDQNLMPISPVQAVTPQATAPTLIPPFHWNPAVYTTHYSTFDRIYWNSLLPAGVTVKLSFPSMPGAAPVTGTVQNCLLANAMLDTFSGAPGAPGPAWLGTLGATVVSSGVLRLNGTGPLYWKPQVLPPSQEASVILASIDTNGVLSPNPLFGVEHGLLLKVQGDVPDYTQGAIKVVYDSKFNEVRVDAYNPRMPGWQTWLEIPNITMQNGDRLSATVQEGGGDSTKLTIEVAYQKVGYPRPHLLGVVPAAVNTSFFLGKPGRIGLWAANVDSAQVDLFARAVNPQP